MVKVLIMALVFGLSTIGAAAAPTAMLPRVLHPAYWDWVKAPGEMYGFWLWTGPDSVRDQADRTSANATSVHLPFWPREDASAKCGVRPMTPESQLPDLPGVRNTLNRLGVQAGVGIGEHNNAFFVRYPQWFWDKLPDAAMRDRNGQVIRCAGFPWPAVDDASLTELSKEQMADMVGYLSNEPWVRYWVLGGEELFPDYVAQPEGDFRPAARRHYTAWAKLHPRKETEHTESTHWRAFRESAVVDHFALYGAYIRKLDPTRPALVPTHGNPLVVDLRARLGYPIADMAGLADGFEAGPIGIDDDDERLIRMTLDMQSSFGVPVTAPRIANKQLDPKAQGGGRSFSPASVRRFVYEALGLGVWHIGLVQWAGMLPDGEWGISGTAAEDECRKVFGELRAAAPYLDNCSRLQPQVALLVSDEAWLQRWRDRWTLAYDEMIRRGWNVTLVTDAQVEAELAAQIPILVSVDNENLSAAAQKRLNLYRKARGRVVSIADAEGEPVPVSHRTQTTEGANLWTVRVRPLDIERLESEVRGKADLRPIAVTRDGRRADGIEALPLTDGTNVMAVLINRSAEKQHVCVALSPALDSRLRTAKIRDAATGKELACSDGRVQVVIEAHRTALLSFEADGDAAGEIETAKKAIELWNAAGADTKLARELLGRAAEHLAAGRDSKALALARTVNNMVALRTELDFDGKRLLLEAKAWTPEGKPAAGGRVRARFVPGAFEWKDLPEVSPGVFRLTVPEGSLPRVYDPAAERYDLPKGALQLIFTASLGGLCGGGRAVL